VLGDEPTGVHADEPPGADDDHPNLQEYVDKLEAELDAEIASLDSDYESNDVESDTELDDTFEPIDNNETAAIHADATREQGSADNMDDEQSNDSDDEEDDNMPLPKLRRR
jgi:hypothetical protein